MLKRSTLEIVMGLVVLIGAGIFSVLVYQPLISNRLMAYRYMLSLAPPVGCQLVMRSGCPVSKLDRSLGSLLTPSPMRPALICALMKQCSCLQTALRASRQPLCLGVIFELLPGAGEDVMPEGTIIFDTRDPVSLSDLLGKIVFQGNES